MSNPYVQSRKGFKWSATSSLVKGVLGFLTVFALTYFLGPEKLGVISIIMVIYVFSETIVQFGISQSIISRGEIASRELSSIFWVNVAIGFVLFAGIFLLAPVFASLYDTPELTSYVKVLSLCFLIEPLGLVFRAILEKEIQFGVLEKINMLRTIVLSALAVLFVAIGLDVMGYVYALVVATAASVLMFAGYFIKKKIWFPSFHFSFAEIKSHYSFGIYVTLKQILNYAGRNLDELIIGFTLGLEVLGVYYFAKKTVGKPSQLLSASFSKVAFPFYAKLKDNKEKLTKSYYSLTHMVSALGMPAFVLGILAAPFAVPLIFGSEWQGSVFLIQIFGVIAFLDIVSLGFSAAVLYVFQKPRFVFLVDFIMTPISLLVIYVASLHSIELVILALLVTVFLKFIIMQWKANQVMGAHLFAYLKSFLVSFQNVIVASGVGLMSLWLLGFTGDLAKTLILVLPFSVVYVLLFLIRERHTFHNLKKLVKE